MRTFYNSCTRVILTALLALLLASCAVTLPIKDKATGLTVPGYGRQRPRETG